MPEALVVVYALAFAVVALVRRRAGAVFASLLLASVAALSVAYASPLLRALAPHVFLLGGYWLPSMVVSAYDPAVPAGRFEAWLIRSDELARPRLPAVPRPFVTVTELAYLFCYPLVPLSFGLVWWNGTPAHVEYFWVGVLGSGYACYATLPWLVSRPPRLAVVTMHDPGGVRALNALVLGRFSHHLNTFPSGHVAVSSAAAIAVWRVWPAAGLVIAVLAAAVGVGAAAGRYHYVVDVLAGVLVAIVVAMVTW